MTKAIGRLPTEPAQASRGRRIVRWPGMELSRWTPESKSACAILIHPGSGGPTRTPISSSTRSLPKGRDLNTYRADHSHELKGQLNGHPRETLDYLMP